MENQKSFSHKQMLITVLFMIAYSVLYFMRLNVSLALIGMEQGLSASLKELGLVGTVFSTCYAFGQLIFGFLGDRFPVRTMVTVGLVGSGVVNLSIGFAGSIGFVTVAWAVNGLFQSMLWSPMMKCVAKNFDGDRKVRATFSLSITQVIGYILAWVGSYFIETYLGWRFVFLIPATLGIAYGAVFFFLFRFPSDADGPSAREEVSSLRQNKGNSLIRQPVLIGFLGVIAVFSVLLGLVRSSIDNWFPTMIEDFGGLSEEGIVVTLILIPFLNFAGIMLAKFMVKKMPGDIYKCILIVWGLCLAVSLVSLIFFGFSPMAYVVVAALLFGSVYALTPLFTSFVPLDFAQWDCVSSVTGFVDFAIYFGAGITGVVSGILLGTGSDKNWSALNLYWFLILAVGMFFSVGMFFWYRKLRSKIHREDLE